jgi:hypothetical protein
LRLTLQSRFTFIHRSQCDVCLPADFPRVSAPPRHRRPAAQREWTSISLCHSSRRRRRLPVSRLPPRSEIPPPPSLRIQPLFSVKWLHQISRPFNWPRSVCRAEMGGGASRCKLWPARGQIRKGRSPAISAGERKGGSLERSGEIDPNLHRSHSFQGR